MSRTPQKESCKVGLFTQDINDKNWLVHAPVVEIAPETFKNTTNGLKFINLVSGVRLYYVPYLNLFNCITEYLYSNLIECKSQ